MACRPLLQVTPLRILFPRAERRAGGGFLPTEASTDSLQRCCGDRPFGHRVSKICLCRLSLLSPVGWLQNGVDVRTVDCSEFCQPYPPFLSPVGWLQAAVGMGAHIVRPAGVH